MDRIICLAGPVLVDSFRGWLREALDPAVFGLGMGGTPVNLLGSELLRRGHTLIIVTLDPRVSDPITLRGEQLTLVIGPFRPRARTRLSDFFRVERTFVQRTVETLRPAVAHANWTYEYALGVLATGVPHVVTAHDAPWRILRYHPDVYRVGRLLMAYRALRAAKSITAVSPYVKQHLESYRFTKRPIAVVPNGLSEEIFSLACRKPKPAGTLTFATALSGWGPLKNGEAALEAFALARRRHPAIRLLCFGPGYGPGQAAQAWAMARNCGEAVEFVGPLAHATLLGRLASQVDVLIHPSREESHSMSLIEGMALGLAVIGGEKSGAVPWTLSNGATGLLTDVSSPEELAKSLERLIEDDELRFHLGNAGRADVRARFHISTVAQAYEEVYRGAARGE